MVDRQPLSNGKNYKIQNTNLPATYAEFASACSTGQFLDIVPNDSTGADAGVSVIGTPLNTANLLSNNTAQSLGLTSSATVDTAFAEIANALEVVNTITFATSDWESNSGAYKAVKNVSGVTANSKPIPSLHYSTMVEATCKNEAKAYSKIIKFETASGTITAWAYSVPAVAVSVDFRGI